MDFSQFNSAEQAHMFALLPPSPSPRSVSLKLTRLPSVLLVGDIRSKIIEKKQMQDFMKLYSGLVERCFNNCVNDFTSKVLTGKESTCVSHCSDKFLKHSERVGARFAEHNAAQMQGGQP